MTKALTTAAIIVAAGQGLRTGDDIPKQFRTIAGKPMLRHSVERFIEHPAIDAVFVVVGEGQQQIAQTCLAGLLVDGYVVGGAERRDSVRNALAQLSRIGGFDQVLIHDAARPFLPANVIHSLIAALRNAPGAVPALPVVDTLAASADGATISGQVDRAGLWRIQTPQAFRYEAIKHAHAIWPADQVATDDAHMARAAGYDVTIVPGDDTLAKFTFASDFNRSEAHKGRMATIRTGTGFDVHRLVTGKELWLCGIRIEHDLGLDGHSDADVALHALTDAILGAAAIGDIGDHFPPSDPQWAGAASARFLEHAVRLASQRGYGIANADVTIICEKPKIGPYKLAMRQKLAEILGVTVDDVSVKATTTEKLGFTGRGEGIAAQAIVTLERGAGNN